MNTHTKIISNFPFIISFARTVRHFLWFAAVNATIICHCNSEITQEYGLEDSILGDGIRIEIFQSPNILINDIRELPNGDILALSTGRVVKLSPDFKLIESVSYGWNSSSDRRTWGYSPHFVLSLHNVYVFGKYRLRDNPIDEYLFFSSFVHPPRKVSLDVCQKTRHGWRGGYCGQFDNFALADFWGNGNEQVIVNELPLEHRGNQSASSRIHILDVNQIVDSDPLETLHGGIQTIETDPINYSYPLTRSIEDSRAEEVLVVTYPSKWTSKSHKVRFNAHGDVRLARLYGNSDSDQVEIDYLSPIPVKHKNWHLVESSLYSDVLLARTLKNGRELELRDLKGNLLNSWKLGRDHIGVERILLYHEFSIKNCEYERLEECFRTVVVLTNDWFSCKTSAALFAGKTDKCPTKILELHQGGVANELHAIRFEEPHYSIFSARTVLNDGRAVFATLEHIYAISIE